MRSPKRARRLAFRCLTFKTGKCVQNRLRKLGVIDSIHSTYLAWVVHNVWSDKKSRETTSAFSEFNHSWVELSRKRRRSTHLWGRPYSSVIPSGGLRSARIQTFWDGPWISEATTIG